MFLFKYPDSSSVALLRWMEAVRGLHVFPACLSLLSSAGWHRQRGSPCHCGVCRVSAIVFLSESSLPNSASTWLSCRRLSSWKRASFWSDATRFSLSWPCPGVALLVCPPQAASSPLGPVWPAVAFPGTRCPRWLSWAPTPCQCPLAQG